MWLRQKKKNLDHAALDATPCDIDLSGHWLAWEITNAANRVLYGVTVEQHGTAVFGRMQCKFAAAAALNIRGIICDRHLIANFWRPDDYLKGSGMMDFVVETEGESIAGTSKWYNAGTGECFEEKWQWERGPAE